MVFEVLTLWNKFLPIKNCCLGYLLCGMVISVIKTFSVSLYLKLVCSVLNKWPVLKTNIWNVCDLLITRDVSFYHSSSSLLRERHSSCYFTVHFSVLSVVKLNILLIRTWQLSVFSTLVTKLMLYCIMRHCVNYLVFMYSLLSVMFNIWNEYFKFV